MFIASRRSCTTHKSYHRASQIQLEPNTPHMFTTTALWSSLPPLWLHLKIQNLNSNNTIIQRANVTVAKHWIRSLYQLFIYPVWFEKHFFKSAFNYIYLLVLKVCTRDTENRIKVNNKLFSFFPIQTFENRKQYKLSDIFVIKSQNINVFLYKQMCFVKPDSSQEFPICCLKNLTNHIRH